VWVSDSQDTPTDDQPEQPDDNPTPQSEDFVLDYSHLDSNHKII
jgi:hypothetical protein